MPSPGRSCRAQVIRSDRKHITATVLGKPVKFVRDTGLSTRTRKSWAGGAWKLDPDSAASVPLPAARERRRAGEPVKVIPFSVSRSVADALDEAVARMKCPSRISFLRRAVADALRKAGEDEVAEMLAPQAKA